MGCGIDKKCIEAGIRATFDKLERDYGGDFLRIEAALARAAGRTPNGVVEREEVDAFIKLSGTTSGSGFIHKRVVAGALDALDTDKDGVITVHEWNKRRR